MAANMMEILKQIQRDLAHQKEYMRNLHVITKNLDEKYTAHLRNYNLIEGKIIELDNKTDKQDIVQQKVLVTMERLEQQIKKNNIILFGNDTEINEADYEDRTTITFKSDFNEKETPKSFQIEQPEKSMENTEEGQEDSQLEISPKIALEDETENNLKEKSKNNDHFRNAETDTDKIEEMISEMRETKQKIEVLLSIKNTPDEDAATCPFYNQYTTAICGTHSNPDQINMINDKLDSIIKMYQLDMLEIKVLINDFIATGKLAIEETAKAVNKQEAVKVASVYFSAEQISQLNDELKRFTNITLNETREINKIIKDSVVTSKTLHEAAKLAFKQETNQILKQISETNQSEFREVKNLIKTRNMPGEDSTSTLRKQKTVQISPTYFNADQISKLNSELKRIAEKYQKTNLIPIIQVAPGTGDKHPVMLLLRQGVNYSGRENYRIKGVFKLGCDGLKRSDVIDMITDYPDLSAREILKEWLVSTNKWDEWNRKYNFSF